MDSMSVKERIYSFCKSEGITIKSFEERCDLSNGYVSSMRKGLGADKLNNVLSAFPRINREWLLYGEGEMYKDAHLSAVGNYNISQSANGNNITQKAEDDATVARFLSLLEKKDEQIDRLLSILEKQ